MITPPEESYRLWCVVAYDLETSKMRRPRPAVDRSATEKIFSLPIVYDKQTYMLYASTKLVTL